jgi:hypothetical protein
MTDNESFILKPKDSALIVKLQDPTELQRLLENPLEAIAEVVSGYFASGNGYWAHAGLRIVQGAFKARLFEQFDRELRELRKKGKLPGDFSGNKNGYKSWIELLTVLDEEVPDEDRLEALKAMFFAVNKVGIGDKQRVLNYQLFQIAKRLTSGELLLMKAVFEGYRNNDFSGSGMIALDSWARNMSSRIGHGLASLVIRDSNALEQQGLINARIATGGATVALYAAADHTVHPAQARITDLGIRFCENLQTYQIEKSSQA